MSFAAADVEGDDAQQAGGGPAFEGVLDQSGLHHADQGFAVWRDGQAFHAFVGGASAGVAADFVAADGLQVGDEQVFRKFKAANPLAVAATELVDVGAVLVGDEDGVAVIGEADGFGVEAGVARVAGVVRGVEVVGASGEEVFEASVLFGNAGAEGKPGATVEQRSPAVEQGRCLSV